MALTSRSKPLKEQYLNDARTLLPRVCIVLMFTLASAFVLAEVPSSVAYRAYLTDQNGDPIDGSVNLTFSLYTDTVGGTAIWTETHNTVVVAQGNIAVRLGTLTPLGNELFEGDVHLGIQVNADPEMSPRLPFDAVLYALIARRTEGQSAPPSDLGELSDEFTRPGALANWILRSDFEAVATDGASIIESGVLRLWPGDQRYFLGSNRGLSMFKPISSSTHPNFVFETHVHAVAIGTSAPPADDFNAAGLVIFPNLASVTSWVVTNIGRQSGSLAFEEKNTVNNSSNLILYDTGGEHSGFVRLCVFGPVITVYTRLQSASVWTERSNFTHSIGPMIGAGVMINDFGGNQRVEGQFEYVRFKSIADPSECTDPVAPGL